MGIDKSNVRWVIHYNLKKHRRLLSGNWSRWSRWFAIRNRIIRKLWRCDSIAKFASQGLNAEVQLAKLERMKQADALSCRRKYCSLFW
jgi:ATP-dependent DNA helicase RecQ